MNFLSLGVTGNVSYIKI